MSAVVADTHALVWYLFDPDRLSPAASAALNEAIDSGEGIHVSAISLVELCYLTEKGRLPAAVLPRLWSLLTSPTAGIRVAPLDAAVASALASVPRATVPDMPDRIIAATAVLLGYPLISRDGKILASGIHTIW